MDNNQGMNKARPAETNAMPNRGSNGYSWKRNSEGGSSDSYDPSTNLNNRFANSKEMLGVHSTRNYYQPHVAPNTSRSSRWDSLGPDSYPTRHWSSRRGAYKNRLGFHGSLRPSKISEKELFESMEHVTEGINFDNVSSEMPLSNVQYDNIPVEVNGDNIPEPIPEFSEEYIPKSLLDNIIRCDYRRPTPVQKYGLAIGCEGRDLMACAQTGSL